MRWVIDIFWTECKHTLVSANVCIVNIISFRKAMLIKMNCGYEN